MLFLYLLVLIFQYIYIDYFLNISNSKIVKSIYNYKLKDGDKEQSATIYRTNRGSKKIIMFFDSASSSVPKQISIECVGFEIDNISERFGPNTLIIAPSIERSSFMVTLMQLFDSALASKSWMSGFVRI